MSEDLFASPPPPVPRKSEARDYDAASIEVLEGLEPVRRRPGMYVGGTDERALHHLAAELRQGGAAAMLKCRYEPQDGEPRGLPPS